MEEHISVGVEGINLIIIPEGHITALLCPGLKTKAGEKLGQDSPVRAIHFDFASCLYMDSTFLGLIVFLAKTARSRGIGLPVVHMASIECKSLFRTMGMLKMLEFSEESSPQPTTREKILANEGMNAGFLYEVHKELSDLSADNQERFSTLTKELEALALSPESMEDLDD
ncbi:MAG: STAS domain-containing protein [Rectinemataceae bacterium]|nr:STAS domain-containing protein [Rectinemataceae bacterium]